jgi:hypothetical protein
MLSSTLTQYAPAEAVSLSRLLWVAPAAISLAAAANAAIYLAADALFGVAWEPAFNLVTVIVGTFAFLLAATLVSAGVVRFARRPLWLFRRVALVALLLSFLQPVAALLGVASMPGSGAAAAPLDTFLTMEVMHLAAYAISVPLLTRLAHVG